MLQSLGRPEVHMALDVMIVSGSGQQHEGCLLLTSEVLFVVSISEDTQQQAFPVTEIDCLEDDQQKDLLKVQLKQQRVPSDLEVKTWVPFPFKVTAKLHWCWCFWQWEYSPLGWEARGWSVKPDLPLLVGCDSLWVNVSPPFHSLIDCDIPYLWQKFSEGKSRGSLSSWWASPLFWKGSHSHICMRCLASQHCTLCLQSPSKSSSFYSSGNYVNSSVVLVLLSVCFYLVSSSTVVLFGCIYFLRSSFFCKC